MSQSAQVHSIDLLKRLHAVLARFGVDAQTALGGAQMEILRVYNALEERLKFWQREGHKRHEEMAQARAALSHARAMHEGHNIGTIEQELALRKAKERLREAEEKVVIVRRWQRELPELVKDLEGPARALSGFLEADLRQALVLLENKIGAPEGYLAISSPTDAAPAASGGREPPVAALEQGAHAPRSPEHQEPA